MVAYRTDTLTEVFSEPCLFRAWEAVARKRSAPGIDHVTVEAFSRNAPRRLREIREQVIAGCYQPDPLVVFPKEKSGGGLRELSIATVRDRVTARCAADALNRRFDARLQPQSYAYRPRKSALRAVGAVQQACRNASHILRLDVAAFFDSIGHGILRERLLNEGEDEPFVNLIVTLIRQSRFDGVEKRTPPCGIPQGSQLAPVLSNIYLDPFDRQLCDSGRRFVRYADDLVAFAANADEAGETLNQCSAELATLGLRPNLDKTRIYRVDDGFLFLGFIFNRHSHVASPSARAALRQKLDGGAYEDEAPAEWAGRRTAIIRGWNGYFHHNNANRPKKNQEQTMKFKLARRTPITRVYTDLTLVEDDDVRHMSEEEEDEKAGEACPADDIETAPPDVMAADEDVASEAETETEPKTEPEPAACEEPAEPRHELGVPFAERLRMLRDRAPALLAGQDANELAKDLRNLLNADDARPSDAELWEVLRLLAKTYRALGLYGAAWRCLLEAGDSPEKATAHLCREGEPPIPFGARDVDAWIEIFRTGPVYTQFIDRIGRSGYRPFSGELTASDLKDHWQGKRTLSVSVFDTQGKSRFGVIDLDISRQTLDRLDLAGREALRERLLDDARALLERARRAGVDGVIEDSSLKGSHLWFFFRSPLSAARVRAFLAALCAVCGQPPEGTHRELFPGSDTCPEDGLNSRMRLPLGIHRVTGERSRFLSPDGTPCAIGTEIPSLLSTLTGQRLAEATAALTATPSRQAPASPAPHPAADARIAQVTAGCGVLRALRAKAEAERHLTHADRIVLRGILAPLGDDGLAELHRILSRCDNYSRATTAKYAAVPFSTPIGCTRIREALGEFADQAGCTCSFKPRKNSYPNPLRHIRKDAEPETVETAHAAPHAARPAGETSAPPATPQHADPAVALLAAYRAARQNLLVLQRQLLALAGGAESVETSVGKLRLAGADTELLKWQLDLA